MKALDTSLRQKLKSGRYALIGAGQLGAMSLAMWPKGVPRPEFVLDSVKRGRLEDLPIHDLNSHRPVPGMVYLLSAFKLSAPEVKALFRRLEQDQVLTVYDLFEETMPHHFGNGWRNLTPTPDTLERLSVLSECLADKQSANTAKTAIAWRYRRQLEDTPPIELEAGKYNLSAFNRAGFHYDCVFDCGSYDLGLLHALDQADISFDTYVALEADPTRFQACATLAAKLSPDVQDRLVLRNEAVSDRVGFQTFLASGLLAARLLAEPVPGDDTVITVPTTDLDSVAQDINAIEPGKRCLIKLHVEGAELPALIGVSRILDTMQADLLINLSHNERQFIEVPALLARHDSFDLYLRSHSLFGEGLTLFARYKT